MSQISKYAVLTLVAVSLTWPLGHSFATTTSMTMLDSGVMAEVQPHHLPSGDDPCDSPDCVMHADCPTGMALSDCHISGLSCSLAGATIPMHAMDEQWLERGAATFANAPPGLILDYRPVSIFHPPRVS